MLPGINVSSGLELWQKHTSVVSTVQCHYMGVSQTDAKNDATARSAARSYTMNVKYKTVFKRCRIYRYENCMVVFISLSHGFGSSGTCRLRRELML